MSQRDSAFESIDTQEDPALFFKLLDYQAEHPAIISIRENTNRMIAARPGMRILDVGSGTGEVARTLAAEVMPGGSVLGVDLSDRMLDEARRRTTDSSLAVSFDRADATKLDFPDAFFDAIHSERTLQHIPDVDAAFAELLRVLKPGGRLVIADTDWDSFIIALTNLDLARKVARTLADTFSHPNIGRRLHEMFLNAGLHSVEVVPISLTMFGERAKFFSNFAKMGLLKSLEGESITGQDHGDLLSEWEHRTENGTLFTSLTMFAVCGSKAPR